jgi:hypothetical protein
MAATKTRTTFSRTIQVQTGAAALSATAPNAIAPNAVFQGQEVKFSITPWPPSALNKATGTIYTDEWTIKPAAQSPTNYEYHNVERVVDDTGKFEGDFAWDTSEVEPGTYDVFVTLGDGVSPSETLSAAPSRGDRLTPAEIAVKLRPIASGDVVPVTMTRAAEPPTSDAALWVAIRYSTNQLSFPNFVKFVDTIMCSNGGTIDTVIDGYLNGQGCLPPLAQRRFTPFPNMDAYRVLKIATECFMMLNCGVYLEPDMLHALVNNQLTASIPPKPGVPFPPPVFDPAEDAARLDQSVSSLPEQITNWWNVYLRSANQNLNSRDQQSLTIPYLALVRSRLKDLPLRSVCEMGMECYGILQRKLTNPCLIELIWSYWHEEAMLVQTLNAISRRFQNLRGRSDRDPLARFDVDPLRRLNSFLWGYVQDEQHRLTVVRRAYEYNHEYGLTLEGKAVRAMMPSDSRSKFLEAFHNLLYLCTIFFKEDDDTTVVADGFPLLNALREVHYILAAGAHNQFGELPSTARQEMLMQQWLLARPEMREFLGGKIMVPYPEEWMDRVDSVKSMQGWTDVSVVHFHDLAAYGEQIVLSIRYGAWSLSSATATRAANWVRYWRNEIQGYIHAYRAATGVDVTSEPVNSTLPSLLLMRRLAMQRPMARLS